MWFSRWRVLGTAIPIRLLRITCQGADLNPFHMILYTGDAILWSQSEMYKLDGVCFYLREQPDSQGCFKILFYIF